MENGNVDVENNEKSLQQYKWQVVIGLTIFYVINLAMFYVAWIVGSVNIKTGHFEVLSYFLVYDKDSKIIYLVWFVSYVFFNLSLMYVAVKIDIRVDDDPIDGNVNGSSSVDDQDDGDSNDNENDEVCRKNTNEFLQLLRERVYIFCTYAYIPVNFLRLFGFVLLYHFNMHTYKEEHFIWTAVAMIASSVCSSLLFIRRVCSRVYKYIGNWMYLAFAVNIFVVVLQVLFICLLHAASDKMRGVFELMVAVFIGIDPVYQVADLYFDYRCTAAINVAGSRRYRLSEECSSGLRRGLLRREIRMNNRTPLTSNELQRDGNNIQRDVTNV